MGRGTSVCPRASAGPAPLVSMQGCQPAPLVGWLAGVFAQGCWRKVALPLCRLNSAAARVFLGGGRAILDGGGQVGRWAGGQGRGAETCHCLPFPRRPLGINATKWGLVGPVGCCGWPAHFLHAIPTAVQLLGVRKDALLSGGLPSPAPASLPRGPWHPAAAATPQLACSSFAPCLGRGGKGQAPAEACRTAQKRSASSLPLQPRRNWCPLPLTSWQLPLCTSGARKPEFWGFCS